MQAHCNNVIVVVRDDITNKRVIIMFAINTKVESFETITSDDVLKAALTIKADYPGASRVIGVEQNVLAAVGAAYKTASGLAENGVIITDNIYSMRKLDVAMLIARNDGSNAAVHRAALEVARDVYLTGDLDGKAALLAHASNETFSYCKYLIERKLEKISEELLRRTQRTSQIYNDVFAEVPASPQDVFYEICAHSGKYLLGLPTGYGKTSEIIEPLVREALTCGEKVLVISHRRSINATLCTDIPDVISYDQCTSPEIIKNAKALKIVVNSLSADKFKSFIENVDTVIIDEASQVISHVLGGEVKSREAVWNALNFVVNKAHTAVLADADINARCVKMVGWDHKFYSIKRDHSDITVKTGDLDHVRGLVIEAAAAGENILVSCDGAKAAKALAASIKKRTGVEALVITSENAKWKDQAAFISDPNNTAQQVVIYSPVITSALSITSGHFTKHFGLFSGQVVPSDAIQMLRRDRTAKEFIVGMKAPEYSKQEQLEAFEMRGDAPTTREAILSAQIEEGIKAVLLEALDFDIKPSAFELMRYEHLSDEAWLRDNIQNTLPATMLMQGFNVSVLDSCDEMARLGMSANNEGRAEVNAAAAEKVLASKAATEEKVARVKDCGSVDEAELFQVIRARAEEVIGRDTITEFDAWVWKEGEGEGAIKRFRKLMSNTDTVTNQGKILGAVKTAVERMTSQKDWTAECSAELFDTLNTMRLDAIRLGFSMSKATTEKAKQAAITKIMGQLGLKTKKVNGGKSGYYYVIKQYSFDQMMTYI